jgi:hypothetical protein
MLWQILVYRTNHSIVVEDELIFPQFDAFGRVILFVQQFDVAGLQYFDDHWSFDDHRSRRSHS